MKSTSSTKRSGFTLIELLTVIAIIGILAAVLFPGVQGVMKKAKQSTASTKLRNIVQAMISFSDGKKYIKTGAWSTTNNTSASSIAEYAAVLAYNSSLNSGEIWYVDADKLNESASFPKQVLTGAVGSQQIDTNFKTPSEGYGYHSWTAYTPTSKNLDGNIPLLWSRGLSSAGAWDATNGVWGADGATSATVTPTLSGVETPLMMAMEPRSSSIKQPVLRPPIGRRLYPLVRLLNYHPNNLK